MLGVGVALADFTVAVLHQNCLVVLCAVNNALLQTGVGLAAGHGRCTAAHGTDHGNGRGAVLGADLQTLQVCGAFTGAVFGGVDAAGAGIEPADGKEALIVGALEDLLHRFALVHNGKILLGALEHIRHREDGVCAVELLHAGSRDLCNIQNAGLDQLDHCCVVAQLTIGVNAEGQVGFSRSNFRHLLQSNVDRVRFAVAVCHQQMLGAHAV